MTPQDSARKGLITPALRPRPATGDHPGASGVDLPDDRGLNRLPFRRP